MRGKEVLHNRVQYYIKKIEEIDKQIEDQRAYIRLVARKEKVKLNHLRQKKMLLLRKQNWFSKKLWGIESKLIPKKGWRKL